MVQTRLANETATKVRGPRGQLDVRLALASDQSKQAFAIVCHPHPLHGGTMDNKIVTTLVKTCQGLGLSTVRFNFRGVGQSEGEFDHGEGELEDLLAVIDWVQRQFAYREIWLAGFSFGAAIAARASTQVPVNRLITVAPPVEHFAMKLLPPVTCPWILVQGDRDDVVSPVAVYAWVASRDPKPDVISFPEAGHFFHGELLAMRAEIERRLR